ncbi:MAG: ABC transporter permease, partial [candidate division Zixibacteria bacterium]|nr:ABC transporter permease [candidate division Zixibacteria bacterium]
MFGNYLKIALRNLIRNKTYSFINILGLAVGMAVCILIMLYVHFEVSYDKHHLYGDRTYRVTRNYLDGHGSITGEMSTIAPSFILLLEENFPEIEYCARFYKGQDKVLRYEEKTFVETELFYVEDDIFEIFTIPFVSGNPKTALTEPLAIVLSESASKKYFGDEDPVGKMLIMDDKDAFKITGVMEDLPE